MSLLKGGVGRCWDGVIFIPFKFSAFSDLGWKSHLFCENISMILLNISKI